METPVGRDESGSEPNEVVFEESEVEPIVAGPRGYEGVIVPSGYEGVIASEESEVEPIIGTSPAYGEVVFEESEVEPIVPTEIVFEESEVEPIIGTPPAYGKVISEEFEAESTIGSPPGSEEVIFEESEVEPIIGRRRPMGRGRRRPRPQRRQSSYDAVISPEEVIFVESEVEPSAVSVSPALLAAIGSRPRLSEAYERLVADGWRLGRRNILIGNSDVDLENKILYIDDDEEDTPTLLLWVHDAVLQAYREQDDFRRRAILDRGLEFFSVNNNLTDLESMARVYEWAAWFWIDPTGNYGDVYPFMDDMVLAFTGRTPRLLTENDPIYNILSQKGTRDDSTGFKRQLRDASAQVRHATFSIQVSLRYGRLGWLYAQERELLENNPADFRLNNQCLDIAGRLLTSPTSLSNIGEILRTNLGDSSQSEPWDGPPGGEPDQ